MKRQSSAKLFYSILLILIASPSLAQLGPDEFVGYWRVDGEINDTHAAPSSQIRPHVSENFRFYILKLKDINNTCEFRDEVFRIVLLNNLAVSELSKVELCYVEGETYEGGDQTINVEKLAGIHPNLHGLGGGAGGCCGIPQGQSRHQILIYVHREKGSDAESRKIRMVYKTSASHFGDIHGSGE